MSKRLKAFVGGGIVLFSIVAINHAGAQTCIQPPPDMTGWWPGDGNTNDIAGDRNAVLKNGATFGAGQVGQGFILDGIDDFVDVPHHPALNVGTGDFTVDLWVYFNTTDGEQVLVEKYVENFESTPPGWFLTKLEGNSLRFGTGPALPDHGVDSPPLLLPTNMWIHFAARRSGGVASIFVNGEEVATGPFVDNTDSDSSLKFGHRGSPSDTPGSLDERGFFLNGRIDEVELFVGRALSDAEIQAIFDAGTAGKCKGPVVCVQPPSGLVSWWPGDGNADDIAGSNDGTLVGGATFGVGEVGQAFDSNGATGVMEVSDSESVTLASEFTIDLWFKVRSFGPTGFVIAGHDEGGGHTKKWTIDYGTGEPTGLFGAQVLTFHWNSPSLGPVFLAPASFTPLVHRWYHLAVTKGGSTYTIYIDGVAVSSETSDYPIQNPGAPLTLLGAEGLIMDGFVDEFEIFNRALSPVEIEVMFDAGSAGKCKGPVARVPTSTEQCKKGGWMNLTDDAGRPFKNQGDCVSFVATHGKNRAGG
jgi:hypothetical protein